MKKSKSLSNRSISLNQKKLLVNALTLLRLPLSLAFNLALFYSQARLLLCTFLFFAIILTDIYDGKLARYYQVESRLGAILDVGADFFFVLTANYFLYQQNLLPLALVLICLVKFVDFCLTSYILRKKSDKALFFDRVGKTVAIILYAFPLSILIFDSVLAKAVFNDLIMVGVIGVAILSLISFGARLVKIIRLETSS